MQHKVAQDISFELVLDRSIERNGIKANSR